MSDTKTKILTTVKIVGVPEHFNLPWHLCIENGEFLSQNIDLQWTNVPEGTGKMCEMLRDGTTDIAIILTEGIIKDIIAGNKSKLVQIYVESPLVWGIHVDYYSKLHTIQDLKNKKAAISRLGSGSQLMTFVNAKNQGWNPDDLHFEIVNTIDGAVEALQTQKADYFMWERFMTAPLVEKNIFRIIADCPSPWPCFVVAVSDKLLKSSPEIIESILQIINSKTTNLKNIADIEKIISSRYSLKIEAVLEWLKITNWSQQNLDNEMLNKIQNQLFDLKIIDKKVIFEKIVSL